MDDGKIHISAKKKKPLNGGSGVVKVSKEAYDTLVELYNESTMSMKDIASLMILKSVDRVVFDKEE